VFFLTGTLFRKLVSQQFGQFFFCVLTAERMAVHHQVTAFSLQEALGELPFLLVVFETQINGWRGGGITPGAQIFHGFGPVALEEGGANGTHKGALAGLIGAVDEVDPWLKVIQNKRLAELSELFNSQALEFH
jgi:hypothetical protein